MGDFLKCAWLTAALIVLPVFGSAPTAAAENELYQATVVISGTSEARRVLGFALCLKDVLVKVSGDPRLLDDARVEGLAGHAAELMAGLSYRDRLSGKPIHDEQGTYDRPHDLTCDFDPAKINATLKTLGAKPWLAARPRIVVLLGIRDRKATAETLAEDSTGTSDADMRVSLAAAAEQFGLPVQLPKQAALAGAALTAATLPGIEAAKLDAMAKHSGGDLALSASMVWSDKALGWVTDWRIDVDGKGHRWRISGVGFDDAFRHGLQGAVQVLSGNGEPKDVTR